MLGTSIPQHKGRPNNFVTLVNFLILFPLHIIDRGGWSPVLKSSEAILVRLNPNTNFPHLGSVLKARSRGRAPV